MNAGREFGIVTAGLTKYPPRSFFKWEREYRRSGSQGQTLTSYIGECPRIRDTSRSVFLF